MTYSPTLTRYISGLVTLHRYCLEGGVWATLGVVTGGALVRLMAVIWVVVVMAVVVVVVVALVVVVVVVVLVGGAFTGFSVMTAGLSGLSGRVGGPSGGGGGTRPVVLEGGRGGYLPGAGA